MFNTEKVKMIIEIFNDSKIYFDKVMKQVASFRWVLDNYHHRLNTSCETIWSAIFGEWSGTRQVVATDSILD